MDVIPDPIDIHIGIDAIVLQKRDGHAGDGRRFHVGERALQHADATDADDGLDLSRLDERHDDRAAFGHEHRVTQALRLRLQILDRAKPALLAQQAEFIERRGAFILHPQAFWQQQQPLFKGHAGERFPPHLVIQQHADVIAVNRLAPKLRHEFVRKHLQIVRGHRRHRLMLGHILAHRLQDVIPLNRRLGDVLFRRPDFLLRNGAREGDRRNWRWQRGRHGEAVLAGMGKRQGRDAGFQAQSHILRRLTRALGALLPKSKSRKPSWRISLALRRESRKTPERSALWLLPPLFPFLGDAVAQIESPPHICDRRFWRTSPRHRRPR